MGILPESDGILAFHRCRSPWRDRCSRDPCALTAPHGQESACSSRDFLGLIIPLILPLDFFYPLVDYFFQLKLISAELPDTSILKGLSWQRCWQIPLVCSPKDAKHKERRLIKLVDDLTVESCPSATASTAAWSLSVITKYTQEWHVPDAACNKTRSL